MPRIKNSNRVFLKRTVDAYHNHKRRAEKCRALLDYTLEDLRELIGVSLGDGCPYCGTTLNPASFQLDHKDPISRGGLHSITNITACCRPCNEAKGNMDHDEFKTLLAAITHFSHEARVGILSRLRIGGKMMRR
jgi:5-methylcytosine-specific restriction endonuclease McrA